MCAGGQKKMLEPLDQLESQVVLSHVMQVL